MLAWPIYADRSKLVGDSAVTPPLQALRSQPRALTIDRDVAAYDSPVDVQDQSITGAEPAISQVLDVKVDSVLVAIHVQRPHANGDAISRMMIDGAGGRGHGGAIAPGGPRTIGCSSTSHLYA